MNKLSKALQIYLEGLTVTQGRLAGQPFTVLPWQRRFLRGAFADGIQSASLSVARGNGKTSLTAGLAAASLDGPLALERGEPILVASSFQQARIAFAHCLAFLGDKLADKKKFRVWDTSQRAMILNKVNGVQLRCIGSDPRRILGAAPSLILADEPSAWPPGISEKMLSALRTGAGKQERSLFLSLGTRPHDPAHWFQTMLNGGADYSQSHHALDTDRPYHKKVWQKANPSLKYMPDLEEAIRGEIKMAKLDDSALQSFRSLRLNLGVSDSHISVLLEARVWLDIEGNAEPAGDKIFGYDCGSNLAMSACACFWPAPGRLEAIALFPDAPSLEERGRADGVGSLYELMHARGELMQGGVGHADLQYLVRESLERWGRPVAIVADRWRLSDLEQALDLGGMPRAALSLRGFGYKDGSEDVRFFRRAALSGRLVPKKSLLLRAAMSQARTVSDVSGNHKLAKASEGGRKQNNRDDAAAASILAVSAGMRNWKPHTPNPNPILGVIRRRA